MTLNVPYLLIFFNLPNSDQDYNSRSPRRWLNVMLIFCVRCYRLLGPSTPVYKEIYNNNPLCLTCRRKGGETFPPQSKELMLVEMEKLALIIPTAEERRKWATYFDRDF